MCWQTVKQQINPALDIANIKSTLNLKTEKLTRKELIDIQLKQAGWDISDRTQVIEEFDIKVGLPEGVNEPQTPCWARIAACTIMSTKSNEYDNHYT